MQKCIFALIALINTTTLVVFKAAYNSGSRIRPNPAVALVWPY